MKRIVIAIFVAIIAFSDLYVFGISVDSYENIGSESNYEPLIDVIDVTAIDNEQLNAALRIARMDITATAIFQIGDVTYCFNPIHRTADSSAVRLSGEHISGINVIWTGEYYYTRSSSLDGRWNNASKYAYPLELIDENGNVVKYLDLRKNTEHML